MNIILGLPLGVIQCPHIILLQEANLSSELCFRAFEKKYVDSICPDTAELRMIALGTSITRQ
ncbi:MAG: hypothetical protein CMM23_18785 [Rhodospirillaceae bacterium]|nr:hypothetical protein [Rhodospirillaceae bacterium]